MKNLFYINPTNLPESTSMEVEYKTHEFILRKYGYVFVLESQSPVIKGEVLLSLVQFFNTFNFKLLNIDCINNLHIVFVRKE